jgi:hypothetical protein
MFKRRKNLSTRARNRLIKKVSKLLTRLVDVLIFHVSSLIVEDNHDEADRLYPLVVDLEAARDSLTKIGVK